jgi:hypothetical protein
MKKEGALRHLAVISRIFMTVLILLIMVAIGQLIIGEMLFAHYYAAREQQEEHKADARMRIATSQKCFLPDGSIQLISRRGYSRAGTGYRKLQIYDVNDNLVWEGIQKDVPYEYLEWAQNLRNSCSDEQMRELKIITSEFSRNLDIPVNSEKRTEEVWRYDEQKDFFVGYRYRQGGGKIGYISSAGFTELKSEAKPFGKFKLFSSWVPQNSFSPILLWQTEHRFYQINFEERTVTLIFESTEPEIVFLRALSWPNPPPGNKENSSIDYRPLIHCLTNDGKHWLIMWEPEQRLTVVLPDELRSRYVSLTATKDNIFLRHEGRKLWPALNYRQSPKQFHEYMREYRSKDRKEWVELYKVDDGQLELVNRFDWIRPAMPLTDVIQEKATTPHRFVTTSSPPFYSVIWWIFHDKLVELTLYQGYRGSGEFTREIVELIRWSVPSIWYWNWIVSVAMVSIAFWHGWSRRTLPARLIAWLVFVGAFNIAGLLTYLALNHATVIKCHKRGKSRGLEQEQCIRCGAELPVPRQGKLDLMFGP